MQPSRNNIHVDSILQNLSIQYRNDQTDYIADQIFPVTQSANISDYYWVYDTAPMFTDEALIRAPGTKFPRGGWTMSTATYRCDQYAFEKAMADEDVAEAKAPLEIERTAMEFCMEKINLRKEIMLASECFANSIWTSSDSTATDWDGSSGVPVTVAKRAKRTVRGLTGKPVNAVAMGEIVYDALTLNAQITGKVQYVQRALPQDIAAVLAQAMDLEYLFVSKAVYNTAASGGTASLSAIIDDDALFFYRANFGGRKVATAATMFVYPGSGGQATFERYRDETVKSDIARAYASYDIKVIGAGLGYWLADIA